MELETHLLWTRKNINEIPYTYKYHGITNTMLQWEGMDI